MELGWDSWGAGPHTTSRSSQGEWNLVKRYFLSRMGSDRWGQISLIPSLSLSEISHSIYHKAVKEMLGVSRNSHGNQSIML